ncbi:MAG: hypothetical protein GF310_10125 [candidate division Zixibacteria bacterium]|nr:hypothetical protein [candidate division Zixibacteria bacterium]
MSLDTRGTNAMKAAVFAQAGREDMEFVQDQIAQALRAFESVSEVYSLDAIAENYRGKLVYKPGAKLSSLYHLRILAFALGWRNQPNYDMMISAIKRLIDLSPIPSINVRCKSQLISPASFAMHDFSPEMDSMSAGEWMMWFHRMELLARTGLVNKVPELKQQVDTLQGLLDSNDGWFTKKLNYDYFRRWSSYTGLMLEMTGNHPGGGCTT